MGRQDEDDSEAGLSNFEQRKEAWRSEQDALNFPDEVGAVPLACGTRAFVQHAASDQNMTTLDGNELVIVEMVI